MTPRFIACAKLPAVKGGVLALMAAALFGVSTPFWSSTSARGLGAFMTAVMTACLYAGAAVVGAIHAIGRTPGSPLANWHTWKAYRPG